MKNITEFITESKVIDGKTLLQSNDGIYVEVEGYDLYIKRGDKLYALTINDTNDEKVILSGRNKKKIAQIVSDNFDNADLLWGDKNSEFKDENEWLSNSETYKYVCSEI